MTNQVRMWKASFRNQIGYISLSENLLLLISGVCMSAGTEAEQYKTANMSCASPALRNLHMTLRISEKQCDLIMQI